MSRWLSSLALACFVLSLGCCGPLYRPGGCGSVICDGAACGSGCGSCDVGCSDGCGPCEGCGELYVDPWINHPADCCDPCDSCGNYNGQTCGKCRPVFAGIKSLWGYRCADNCGGGCDAGGCHAGGGCAGGCESGCCGGTGHGTVIHEGGVISMGQSHAAIIEPTARVHTAATPVRKPAVSQSARNPISRIFSPRRETQGRALAY